LYFYLVALIALEVIVWGTIGLARTVFAEILVGGSANLLATGLALVLVGIPIFWLHWAVVQRDARSDAEEHSSRIRALFLYGTRLGLLIPVVQNVLALVSRAALHLLHEDPSQALIGSGQTAVDNLLAIAINLIVWAYIERVLRQDWIAVPEKDNLSEVRRLARFVWVLYALLLLSAGVYQLVQYIFFIPEGGYAAVGLANGLALALIGAPLWVWTRKVVQDALDQPGERNSKLRQVLIYLLALTGLGGTLSAAAVWLAVSLRWIFGESFTLSSYSSEVSNCLGFLAAFGWIWAYYGRERRRSLNDESDALQRANLERFYDLILALAGNAATFFSLLALVRMTLEMLIGSSTWTGYYRTQIASCLAALAVGVPLWVLTWPRQQSLALGADLSGEQARRSVLRKGYLYLILFASVVGAMGTAGYILYLVFSALLGNHPELNLTLALAKTGASLIQVIVWLVYHLRALRQDAGFVQRSLRERHENFPALLIQTGPDGFASLLGEALQRQAPHLPLAVHDLNAGPLPEANGSPRVVVLPAALALHPSADLRAWLERYPGQRILLPATGPDEPDRWLWLGAAPRSEHDLAKETARAIRLLAEGQPFRPSAPQGTWGILASVLAGLFLLQIVFAVLMAGISLVVR
jgi:hypothetical protein